MNGSFRVAGAITGYFGTAALFVVLAFLVGSPEPVPKSEVENSVGVLFLVFDVIKRRLVIMVKEYFFVYQFFEVFFTQ